MRLALVLILLTVVAFGQARLENKAEGYSFLAPRGWKSKATAEGYVISNPAETIAIAVKGHNYADFRAFAADAHLERDGLTLVGDPRPIKRGYHFRTTKAELIIDTFVVFSPNGGGALAVTFAKGADASDALNAGSAIADSFGFTNPKESSQTEKVRNVLSGKHLLFLYTGSGYSERKDIYLCSSGTFYQGLNMGGFSPNDSDDGSFAARGGKTGVWSISPNGQKLILRFQQGGSAEYQLSARQASNEIGMNGQRWFVQSQTVCR